MGNSLAELTRIVDELRRQVHAMSTTPQLSSSSIEDGAIEENDIDGVLRSRIGQQYDGTSAMAVFNGPTPPVPDPPTLIPKPGALVVRWSGTFVDDALWPMDGSRVEVHASTESGFDALSADTLRATIETPRGSFVPVSLPSGVPHYVRLVMRSQAGKASPASVEVAGTPAFVDTEDVADFALNVRKMKSLSHQLY